MQIIYLLILCIFLKGGICFKNTYKYIHIRMCVSICICMWGFLFCSDAYKGSLACYRDNRPSYHQLPVSGPAPSPLWTMGLESTLRVYLFSLYSKLCLPSSGLSSAQGTSGKNQTTQILYQRIKNVLTHCLVL